MSYEPFSDGGKLLIQSGIPVVVKDSGGQGNWVRVPAPLGGEEGEVLTVQPDLSVAWEPTQSSGTTILTDSVVLSNATLKAGTTSTLVSAQGANTVIVPITIAFIMRYGGTNAFTNAPSMQIGYNGSPNFPTLGYAGAAFWTQTNTRVIVWSVPAAPTTDMYPSLPLSGMTNQPLTTAFGAALTGNAANNNTLEVFTTYYVISV